MKQARYGLNFLAHRKKKFSYFFIVVKYQQVSQNGNLVSAIFAVAAPFVPLTAFEILTSNDPICMIVHLFGQQMYEFFFLTLLFNHLKSKQQQKIDLQLEKISYLKITSNRIGFPRDSLWLMSQSSHYQSM